ncbi:imidazoleglycerol-phosphate dehydratase HisB [candidate division NPL-UPA2 bacterium]|nr:imidazoleglycerol-phosphate dehydratase HisB [candidate division NPL-UPA2 bacterium]
MSQRKAEVERVTRETEVRLGLNLEGTGQYKIETGIPFLNHMLSLLARHGLFDLKIEAKGDLKVDMHHTNEDVGICLGKALKKALGDKKGIKRFGFAYVPMDEALARVVLDISGRPSLHLKVEKMLASSLKEEKGYGLEDAKQFLQAFVINSGINMHIDVFRGEDAHHVLEAIFKVLGKALDEATQLDGRIEDIPSTKGAL